MHSRKKTTQPAGTKRVCGVQMPTPEQVRQDEHITWQETEHGQSANHMYFM